MGSLEWSGVEWKAFKMKPPKPSSDPPFCFFIPANVLWPSVPGQSVGQGPSAASWPRLFCPEMPSTPDGCVFPLQRSPTALFVFCRARPRLLEIVHWHSSSFHSVAANSFLKAPVTVMKWWNELQFQPRRSYAFVQFEKGMFERVSRTFPKQSETSFCFSVSVALFAASRGLAPHTLEIETGSTTPLRCLSRSPTGCCTRYPLTPPNPSIQ